MLHTFLHNIKLRHLILLLRVALALSSLVSVILLELFVHRWRINWGALLESRSVKLLLQDFQLFGAVLVIFLLHFFFPLYCSISRASTECVRASGAWGGLWVFNVGLIAQRTYLWVVRVDNGWRTRLILIFNFLFFKFFKLLLHFNKRSTFCPMGYTGNCCKFQKCFLYLWWTRIWQTFLRTDVDCFIKVLSSCLTTSTTSYVHL